MISSSFYRWFAPADFPCPDLTRRARSLWIVSWPFFAVVAVMLSMAVLVEPDTLGRRATTVAAVGALITLLHAISRAGRPALASWILVIGLSVIVTQRAWITGGIHAPVAVFYVIFIVMAGVLLGARGGFVTAAVCFAGAIVLTLGTAMGWLTPRPGAGSSLGGLVFVVLAIGVALVLQALTNFGPRREGLGLNAQMVVHDMRSPILALLARLELLRGGVPPDAAKDVEGAIDGANSLNRIATTLLDISRLESGRMPMRRSKTDVSMLAQSVVASVQKLQPTRNIVVESHADPVCNCDSDLTRRILENLVTNAMKHTSIDGRVRVVISGSSAAVRISVCDEGLGVPPETRKRIFEPYAVTGNQSLAGYESFGLGLAFCKLAAEAQGGVIRIEDGVPRGSVFSVDLPR
ncbi:MAG TPA: HAMP domain-containing sensor histidine kinase [Gemmatimonadaceae bacterium]